jgi:hypothetical protein
MSKHEYTPARVVVLVIETLILALAGLYLAEYFGWDLVREASGRAAGSML